MDESKYQYTDLIDVKLASGIKNFGFYPYIDVC